MSHQSLVSSIVVQDELCNWEFINQSDIDLQSDGYDGIYDVQSIDSVDYLSSSSDDDIGEHSPAVIDLDSLHDYIYDHDNDIVRSPTIHTPDDVNLVRVHDFGDNGGNRHLHDDVDDVVGLPPIHTSDKVNFARVLDFGVNFSNYSPDLGYDDGIRRLLRHDDDDVEEDESDDGDDYGVDDELVPWGVTDKFERHRIRKLGKRTFTNMAKSGRSGLVYNRRGCVRGKHGLGLKAF